MTTESESLDVIGPILGKTDAPKVAAMPHEPAEERLSRRLRPTGELGETHYRSVVKAVSWRATGTLDTMAVSFLVTGRLKLALSIGFVELFTKIGLYYLHERVWGKIRFGRVRVREDYEI